MEQVFEFLKKILPGNWQGEGFAEYPTIEPTGYTENLTFRADNDKTVILYEQKTRYKNNSANNSKTVFWDTGFIVFKEDVIFLVSAQAGGRAEVYRLEGLTKDTFTFNSEQIINDTKTIRSQRIFTITDDRVDYQLNMSTHQNTTFRNHLKASLKRSD